MLSKRRWARGPVLVDVADMAMFEPLSDVTGVDQSVPPRYLPE